LKDIKIDETNLAFPTYIRYRISPFYAVKLNGIAGFGDGTDEDSRNDRGRSYKVFLTEVSVQAEYYFISEERRYKSAAMFNRRGMLNNYMSFSFYGFAGLGGVYSHTREIVLPDDLPWDDSRENTFAAVVPFGLGLKYIIDDKWLINAELGYRLPFSDYIEGYSQIQASRHNDVYYFLNVNLGYRLETTRKGLPGFLDKDYRRAKPKKTKTNKPKSKREAIK
jgi:hypothetical protein